MNYQDYKYYQTTYRHDLRQRLLESAAFILTLMLLVAVLVITGPEPLIPDSVIVGFSSAQPCDMPAIQHGLLQDAPMSRAVEM